MSADFEAEIEREEREVAQAQAEVARLAREIIEAARPLWRFGDGKGGLLYEELQRAEREAGLGLPPPTWKQPKKKRTISFHVRRQVLERDRYRCVECATWEDLTLDHIQPESQGGTDDPDNLQTMCRKCNSRKGVSV